MLIKLVFVLAAYLLGSIPFGYLFVKAAAFFGAFVFPLVNEALGKAGATYAVSILSLIGFLAAKFILPELYGYVDAEKKA